MRLTVFGYRDRLLANRGRTVFRIESPEYRDLPVQQVLTEQKRPAATNCGSFCRSLDNFECCLKSAILQARLIYGNSVAGFTKRHRRSCLPDRGRRSATRTLVQRHAERMRSETVPVLIAELQRPELIIHESGEQLAVNSQKKLAAEIVQQRADDTRPRAKAAAWLFRLGKAEFVWPLLAANSVFLLSGRASALRVQDRIFNAPAESPENGVVVSLTRSAVVVLPVPIYEFLHAFFDRCAGRKPTSR